jgi:hypothetical protein
MSALVVHSSDKQVTGVDQLHCEEVDVWPMTDKDHGSLAPAAADQRLRRALELLRPSESALATSRKAPSVTKSAPNAILAVSLQRHIES